MAEYYFRKIVEWLSILLFPLVLLYWGIRKQKQRVVKTAQKTYHTFLIRLSLVLLFVMVVLSLTLDFGYINWRRHFKTQHEYLIMIYIGISVTFLGDFLMTWTMYYIRENWTMTTSELANHQLVMKGPYRLCRHSMYTSAYVYCIGIFLLSGYWLIELCLLFMVTVSAFRIRDEERQLVRQFGPTYVDYMKKVSAFVPLPFFDCGVDVEKEKVNLLSEYNLEMSTKNYAAETITTIDIVEIVENQPQQEQQQEPQKQ